MTALIVEDSELMRRLIRVLIGDAAEPSSSAHRGTQRMRPTRRTGPTGC